MESPVMISCVFWELSEQPMRVQRPNIWILVLGRAIMTPLSLLKLQSCCGARIFRWKSWIFPSIGMVQIITWRLSSPSLCRGMRPWLIFGWNFWTFATGAVSLPSYVTKQIFCRPTVGIAHWWQDGCGARESDWLSFCIQFFPSHHSKRWSHLFWWK